MYLVYLSYLFIIGIIYVMYLLKESDKQIRKKHMLIILSVTLIVNSTLLIGYINKKNQLTESTHKIYSSFYDSMGRTRYSNKVETIDDVNKLLEVSKDINKNLSLLEYNLRYSEVELNSGNGEEFYKIVKRLNDYLTVFIYQHNKLYTKKRYVDEDLQVKYSKLKTELNILYDYFRLIKFLKRDRAGTVKVYSIVSKEENFNWEIKVNKRLENIQKLIEK